MLGYGKPGKFNDHIIGTMLGVLKGEGGGVRITNERNILCEECPQKREDHCELKGRKFSREFLSGVDEAVAANSRGAIEISQTHSPDYLKGHMKEIRRALMRTLVRLPLRNHKFK